MSATTRLLGSVLCLAGGCLIGFGSQSLEFVRSAVAQLDGAVSGATSAIGVQTGIPSFEIFLIFGLVLFILGAVVVAWGGWSTPPGATPARYASKGPDACRFCGAPMKGSKTYCPNCGKSQY